MLAFRFQKDRKNATKAFSVYNLDFQNSTYFPIVFPSGRKYAILITPLLTFGILTLCRITVPVPVRHNGRNIITGKITLSHLLSTISAAVLFISEF